MSEPIAVLVGGLVGLVIVAVVLVGVAWWMERRLSKC